MEKIVLLEQVNDCAQLFQSPSPSVLQTFRPTSTCCWEEKNSILTERVLELISCGGESLSFTIYFFLLRLLSDRIGIPDSNFSSDWICLHSQREREVESERLYRGILEYHVGGLVDLLRRHTHNTIDETIRQHIDSPPPAILSHHRPGIDLLVIHSWLYHPSWYLSLIYNQKMNCYSRSTWEAMKKSASCPTRRSNFNHSPMKVCLRWNVGFRDRAI